MKFLITLMLLSVFTTPVWLTNFEAAKEIASKEHKYILLNFSGSDWCAPCVKMKQEVFEDSTFASLAVPKLILLRADFPRKKKNLLSAEQIKLNEALAERYNPNGKFPLTILLDAQGKVINQWEGYVFGSQDKFIQELNALLNKQ